MVNKNRNLLGFGLLSAGLAAGVLLPTPAKAVTFIYTDTMGMSQTLQPLINDNSLYGIYAVVESGGGGLRTSNPQTTITGNIAVGLGSNQTGDGNSLASANTANNFDLSSGSTKSSSFVVNSPGVVRNNQDLTPIANAINDAASRISKLPFDFTYNSAPANNTTINSVASGYTAVTINDDFTGGDVLTLNGGANDYFFLQITGKMQKSGSGGILLSGGLKAENVIVSITSTSNDALVLTQGNLTYGRYLVTNSPGRINLSGGDVVGGIYNTSSAETAMTSAATVTNPVPEPLTMLGAATAASFGAFFKRHVAKKKKSEKEPAQV